MSEPERNDSAVAEVVYLIAARSLAVEGFSRLHALAAGQVDRRFEVIRERRGVDRRRTVAERHPDRRRRERRLAEPDDGSSAALPFWAAPFAEALRVSVAVEPVGNVAEERDTQALIERSPADRDTFDRLYNRYYDRVFTYLASVVRDHHTSEELAQEVFVRLHRRVPSLRRDEAVGAWIFSVARNCARDHLRRAGLIAFGELGDSDLTTTDEDQLFTFGWVTDRRLAREVERLPDRQREAVVLRYVFDFDLASTARATKTSEGAIKQLSRRGLARLKSQLEAGQPVAAA